MPSPLAPRSTSRKPAIKFQVKHQGVEGEALRLAVHLMAFALLPTGCIAYTAVLACSSDPAVRLSVAMDSGRAQVVALSLFSRACSISWVAHRLLAHRSYHPTRRFRFLLALWACGAWSGSPFAWAAKHRVHHKLSDTPDDPEVMDMHAPMHALSRSRAACPIRPHTPQPFHSHRANRTHVLAVAGQFVTRNAGRRRIRWRAGLYGRLQVRYGRSSFVGRGWAWVFDWRGELNDWSSSW